MRPSLYKEYVSDNAYTGSSWQRTNNIQCGIFDDDEQFLPFAAHAAVTYDDLATVTDVNGWFAGHKDIKDLSALAYTSIHALRHSDLQELRKLEKIELPATFQAFYDNTLQRDTLGEVIADTLDHRPFAYADRLRYVNMVNCDSTTVIDDLRGGIKQKLGIAEQALVYLPSSYGQSDGTNVVVNTADGSFKARAYLMADNRDYCVPIAFETDSVINTRTLPTASVPYTVCVPYKLKVPAYSRAYQLSERSGNTLVFKEVKGDLEAMRPCLLKVVGNKRLRKTSTTLNTDIQQTIPANGGSTYGRQDDAPGYSLRGTFDGIDNQTAGEMGAYILQSDGDWHPVVSSTDAEKRAEILPFRAFLLPSMRNAKAQIGMHLDDADTDGIDTLETIDEDGTHRYYDLSGRELPGRPARGIYIYNGKKYLNK